MKTTLKFLLLVLAVGGMFAFASCTKGLPEKVNVSGVVTDKDGHAFGGVRVGVYDEPWFSGYGHVGDWCTDENGHYEVEFEPHRSSVPYTIHFDITKDDGEYSYNCEVDIWEAEQEINVVLMKKEE